MSTLPVAVIGAGPVGLAAAAHLAERGQSMLVFEAGPEPGHSVRAWGHVQIFSPWRYNVDTAAVRLLEPTGWQLPDPDGYPTGDDLIDAYVAPLAAVPAIAPHLHLNSRVQAVTRKDTDKVKSAGREKQPFILRIADPAGQVRDVEARAVIDASGTWHQPNPLGAAGIPAAGEADYQNRIRYGIPDVRHKERHRYAGKRVLVAGSGHSAINVILDLLTLQDEDPSAHVIWAMRSGTVASRFQRTAPDELPARGALEARAIDAVAKGRLQVLAPFPITSLQQLPGGAIAVTGRDGEGEHTVEVDEIIAATGSRPDLDILRELRLSIDPWLESVHDLGPLIDPNIHSCGTVPPHGAKELAHPDPGFYITGMKSYGRAPTFLLMTGYEQVRSVVAKLAGDEAAAAKVELTLPETGVCSGPGNAGEAGCCGPRELPVVRATAVVSAPETQNVAVGSCCTPASGPTGRC